jgi:hypothetical protein
MKWIVTFGKVSGVPRGNAGVQYLTAQKKVFS